MTVYNRVVFNRGTGLGNRLFPWSRCATSSDETNTPMLAPHWWWPLRQGALFAGGIDRRAYLRQGLLFGVFQPRPNEIAGAKQLAAMATGEIKTFRGEEKQFADIAGKHDVIRKALRDSTRPQWIELADQWKDAVIGINIRRGRDFKDAQTADDYIYKGGLRTPLDWFVDTLRLVRKVSGRNLPAVVVSDGEASDLQQVLNEPDTRLLRPGCPASDLLVLANTKLLLGSGGSSFSAWASYLGAVPVVTIPGQALSWFGLDKAAPHVGTLDPQNADDTFLNLARSL